MRGYSRQQQLQQLEAGEVVTIIGAVGIGEDIRRGEEGRMGQRVTPQKVVGMWW